jgi:3-oxoacyl-(acyl-carrier-protein) synthase
MKRRRVKITGIGPVTPAGIGREEFWKGILEPVSRVRPYTKLGEEFGPFVAAHIDRFNIAKHVDQSRVPKGAARHTLFAIAGSLLALEDAQISRQEILAAECAIVTGSSIMDFGGIGSTIKSVGERGPRGAQQRTIFTAGIGSVPSGISEVLGTNARCTAVTNQCCSGMDAMGVAARMIALGEVDIALCGGTEAPLHRFPLVELRAAELTPSTTERCERIARPFDLWRTTGVVSEGACMFVLEAESSPRPGYSFIESYTTANDETDDLCGGLAAAAAMAIAEARLRASDIDSINAWGPGHTRVDYGEACAMRRLFGEHMREISAVSIKGSIGTPLGAAPAIQIAAAALGQRHGCLPPTVNWEFPDPECPFNLSNRSRVVGQKYTLVNAHGLGAVNSTMVLSRC